MMDGYAIAESDGADRFRVIGEVQAGAIPGMRVRPGECVRIFTGAEVPGGASRVIPQEDVEREGDWMRPLARKDQTFVRRRGSEAWEGAVVLQAGTRLQAADLAILAQVGATHPLVHPRASVCHLATGNELIAPDAPLRPGSIRDTNSTLIAALVEDAAATLTGQDRCEDEPLRLRQWIENAAGDVLLISGGASVGDYDFGARVLKETGFTIHFDKLNLRPGKPLIFATRGGQSAFVIPGNPVSHFVCFHVGIRLAIERLQAMRPMWGFVAAELGGGDVIRGNPRETYWPAIVEMRGGPLIAHPRKWSSSGDTFSLSGTNALLRITADVSPGEPVETLLLGLPR